jgi:hypothetical protein
MTVGSLIHDLTRFAELYEQQSAAINRAEPIEKQPAAAHRDAIAADAQRRYRATPSMDRVRAFVLAHYSADVTISTVRRLLVDLIRTCGLKVTEAEELSLEGAVDRLEVASRRPVPAGGRGEVSTVTRVDIPPPEETIAEAMKNREWLEQVAIVNTTVRELVAPLMGASGGLTTPAPKRKRSTEPGEAQTKLVAALLKHHRYAEGGCLNPEPIGNNALARMAGVDRSTASDFFKNKFLGHEKYRALCLDTGKLVAALKILNGDFAPHILYGTKPPGEGQRDED